MMNKTINPDWTQGYRNRDTCKALSDHIRDISRKTVTVMEVCGTHTVAMFRHGIRSLLPSRVTLLSGPGCPVCVTPTGDLDALMDLCGRKDVLVATFGDLMRVPGSSGSFQDRRAQGADLRVVSSAMDALALAVDNPRKQVVFAGVGFETTAPTVAAAIMEAQRLDLSNFFVYSAHKLTPPAVAAVMGAGSATVHGLILPGHVCAMTGADYFRGVVRDCRRPAAVTGFDPVDLLRGIAVLIEALESAQTGLYNAYERAVSAEGNRSAMALMNRVFTVCDSRWRGIGTIPSSGLAIAEPYARFDAAQVFGLYPSDVPDPLGCACGDILTGKTTPPSCPLFGKTCTPSHPVGPCMVSGEGTCAAYHHFGGSNT